MKTYEETAQYILEVRNEHEKKIKRRKALAMRIIPAAAGICSAVVICFAALKNNRKPIDLITDESVITGGSVSVVTTVPHGTEEAVTTQISTAQTITQTTAETTAKTTAETTVSAASVTAAKATVQVEQSYAKTTNVLTAAATSAVHTTAASTTCVTATMTAETVTADVTTQVTTEEPINTGGWHWNGNGDGDWNYGGFGGFGGGGNAGGGEGGGEDSGEEQWLQLPINEKYCYAYIYGYDSVYVNLYMISPEYAGERIDSADMLSGQMIGGQQMQCSADVYSVNGIADASAVAVKFEGNEGYYLYYKPNADLYKITQTVPQA
ncbi:hypothetical protein [Ruminococcus flavefaciens]|uniref:hypothetical protein n=1 Tax=Ruminococcus flavefaciens TaxID=1265 RepID=UPI0004651FBD|nr:hypothetical protein [Ruminococcus flavefaciens]